LTNILVIPDSHAQPGVDNVRFERLGKLIYDIQPDVVVDIGDSADMASLCSHGTAREQRLASYRDDIAAYQDAQEKLWHPFKRNKKRMPRKVKTQGNHENRINRFIDEHPLWEGIISEADLCEADFGWEVSPFLVPVDVAGIDFCHYYTSGVMNRPIGGEHMAYSILKKRFKSSVQGHHHGFDYKVLKSTARTLHGLVVGCYLDAPAGYAGPANALWSSGVALLKDAENGQFDLEWISIERIERAYA
jgi:hypothetical protein